MFTLTQATRVTLELYDVSSRKWQTIASGEYSSGLNEVSWSVGELSKGAYVIGLSASNGAAGKVVVIQ